MPVIILNGASSSGKSSIAKQLQALLPEYYLHLGIDTFIAMMPEKSNQLTVADQKADGFYFRTVQQDGDALQRIDSGSYGKQINQAYHESVQQLAHNGLNVIVDDIMNGKVEQDIWQRVLSNIETLFVGIHCETSTLVQRERQRQDRVPGSAREQAGRVHLGVEYDLEISTTTSSPQQCAKLIAQFLKQQSQHKA
ncbi:chloramphenicol phosphotransferase [Bacterioplanes sanyensis]|uniref:Chloramphenicol phosphotransferase n=1 Tax=Bacterioplanes sanyensis TaxID=1249553 RepID=A0A222FKD9_9GAMM|nr:AAA family ATPase [Bacterioplanes sanyensis]ASP39122.1 chloramphenicol phosphotransferase [Bacterioplanes sanyensis]